jgi:transcriptional regulator with XRE-family HTH domain
MDAEIFDLDKALDALGWRRVDLAARLGMTPESISRWKKNVPQYAVAYLDAMLQIKKIRDFLDKRLAA